MIIIRRIKETEWEMYKKIRLESLKESPSSFSSTYEAAITRNKNSWNDQVKITASGSSSCIMLVFSDDQPIGIAALYKDEVNHNEGEIFQVWVSPNYRGTNISTDLLIKILNWGKDSGINKVKATIVSENYRAISFYKKHNFIQYFQHNQNNNEITMYRLL